MKNLKNKQYQNNAEYDYGKNDLLQQAIQLDNLARRQQQSGTKLSAFTLAVYLVITLILFLV